ncbi:hypothetical protein [Oceanirhabdus sp. W0125-5]|uniref:hypothetical protein n=1 Tax=Oceanirhabdus sp. W0125-5 TaxID=2999116 RepID=UPI0022F3269E|nr:hypothetical protein [Oceanirhabdus sp. W0125-5]WBW99302.1 hypothetical protein OW730_11290 [Oceanirhabdus sp. W0125-5]
MAGFFLASEEWKKTREKGKYSYIFFKTIIVDYIIGLPFFILAAPLLRSNFSMIYLKEYLKSSNLIRDIVLYCLAIFVIRIAFRFFTWNYYECKYKLWKEKK